MSMLSRHSHSGSLVGSAPLPMLGGPTFVLRHRILRALWSVCWLVLASWTPPAFQPLRRFLLRLFGAEIDRTAMVRATARIWWPAHLSMGEHASLGPGAICYNVAPIVIEDFAVVSQRAHLCTGTHDVDHPDFPLRSRPIRIGRHAWIAAEAFVGPGVSVGAGAVLGARAVAVRDLDAWTVYAGNPSRAIRSRAVLAD